MRAPFIPPSIGGDSAMPLSDPHPPAGAAVPSAGATASSAGGAAGGAATQALTALRGDYPVFAPGEVWLAGAGPGDPGLLTLDALAALLQADVVVHDALVDARVLALARTGAQLQFAGKRGGKPSIAQEDICLQLVAFARRGFRVLRLKGGDPFVFGRGGEEMLALAAAGVPFRVIPGVTAGLGGLASVGIPATMRGVNQAIILATGHDPDEDGDIDWSALARTHQPIVLYMGLRNLDKIAQALMRGGLPASTPAAVIASATLSDQRVLASRLDCIASEAHAANMAAPAMVVIGEIVRTRQQLVDASAHAAAGAPRSACEG
jgi:uroporphyrin-III C-methyltransferase